MKNEKIVIAGGTGFIGQALCNYFGEHNQVVVLTRNSKTDPTNAYGIHQLKPAVEKNIRLVYWDGIHTGEWIQELSGAALLINLAGKSVNCRYNERNKQAIFDSRTQSTQALGEAIRQISHPPKLWINAASATIYPHATDTARDESFTDFADDFSVQVCKKWEQTFYNQRTPFTRKIALRMAITLGTGGVMIPYFNLLKFGLGGRQGSGKQLYSWVHVTDTCRMIEFCFEHPDLEGTFNCSSPNPVSNEAFMRTLRKCTGHRFGLPAYEWMLRIGAELIGTETELILKSRWVVPARIQQEGFVFAYPFLEDALKEIVARSNRKQYHLF